MSKEIWELLPLKDKLLFLSLFCPAVVLEVLWMLVVFVLTVWMYPVIIFRSGSIPFWLELFLTFWMNPLNNWFYNTFRKIAVKNRQIQKEKEEEQK